MSHENAHEFDNATSLAAAHKALPFAKLLAKIATDRAMAVEDCPFCTKGGSGVIRRAVVTKKIDRATIAAVEQVDNR